MKYCTFGFIIEYENGTMNNETSPYRGDSIDEESLKDFVRGYIAGLIPKTHSIEIRDIQEYFDPKEWITDIKDLKIFQGLQRVNGYAGDLMVKYFPEEIKQ